MKSQSSKKSPKKPPKLKKLKYPLTKRRLKNRYGNAKRAWKKSIQKKRTVKKMVGFILFFIVIFVVLAFFSNEFYHKQTFNHTAWLPCFFGVCCIIFQAKYFFKHKKMPNLGHKTTNSYTLWYKIQIVLLNMLMVLFVSIVFGWSSNTLITQMIGQYQPPKVYIISKNNVDSNRHGNDYELYVVNDDDPNDKRQFNFSFGFYNRVGIGDYLIIREICSPLSCYIAEGDVVIVDKKFPRVKYTEKK